MCILDIVKDKMSSNFLRANFRATFVRYIRVRKMTMNNQVVLSLLGKISKNALPVKSRGITDPDGPSLYISFQEDIILIIQVEDAFVNNEHKPATFHANTFHRHARALPDELHVHHLKQDQDGVLTFALFFHSMLQQKKTHITPLCIYL